MQGRLRSEIEGSTTRNYIYGADGVVGYEENNEHFMYRKNFFGDVTAIYKGATKVAEYKYDAWGNCTIILNTSGYGSRNPFRYRGYYFDSDLGMYYLMTRYYDPKTGRFINADSIEYLKPGTINGLNLYAYCGNNPVMYFDPTGQLLMTLGIISFFVVAAVGAVLTVTTAIVIVVVTIGELVELIGELVKPIRDDLEKAFNDPIQFIEERWQKLKSESNTTSDDTYNISSGLVDGAQNSSRFINSYNMFGGANVFETMFEDFHGLD